MILFRDKQTRCNQYRPFDFLAEDIIKGNPYNYIVYWKQTAEVQLLLTVTLYLFSYTKRNFYFLVYHKYVNLVFFYLLHGAKHVNFIC